MHFCTKKKSMTVKMVEHKKKKERNMNSAAPLNIFTFSTSYIFQLTQHSNNHNIII